MMRFKPLKKKNIFHTLFKKEPKINAIIELENLIISNPVSSISIDEVISIETKYNINLEREFLDQRKSFYKYFLLKFLDDHLLTDFELEQLRKLKFLLKLHDDEIIYLSDQAKKESFKKAMEDVVSDGVVSKEEEVFLEQMKLNLGIDEEYANHTHTKASSRILHEFIKNAISDKRLSPEEEVELNRLGKNLNFDNVLFDKPTEKLLNQYRLFWQIENGDVPTIEPDINLTRGEKCYYKTDATWNELRKQTQRINYSGPTMRIKLAKGVYWRAGSVQAKVISTEEYKNLDDGTLYLTSKRLIFIGSRSNKNIRLNKVLNLVPYKDGIDIIKDSGKSPFLGFNDTEVFSMLLGRAIKDY